jgi:uncharacterized protein YciI
MAVFAVFYDYTDDDARRDAVRPAHRAHLKDLFDAGTLLASGPLGGEAPGALIFIAAPSEDAALSALDADPFWTAGLVARRWARPWTPVFGPF